ncbi:hypothetical protein BH18ACI1_BH18ACI1_21530 [soil metagenome]
MGIDLENAFCSHPENLLQNHLRGVRDKVLRRTKELPTTLNLKTAEIAAIFHDLGKINPYFQRKLKGERVVEYSSHAYLSALAWFCFARTNGKKIAEWMDSTERFISVATMLAKHHGNLPNLNDGIFKQRPFKDLQKFLEEKPELPISDFLQIVQEHSMFTLSDSPIFLNQVYKNARLDAEEVIKKPLEFFLEMQFAFACLLESDKRDAGENETYKREDLKPYFEATFAERIDEKLNSFTVESDLNRVRTAMREEVVENLRLQLKSDKRVFTLSAPTGAGKTMMLLALAKEILKNDSDLSVIYALPFLSITEQVEGICKEIFYDIKEFDNGKFEEEVAVMRIDSRSENERIQKLQEEMETDQNKEKLIELLRENFSEETFDHRFIVTTFVQIFETLVSNRNATLLRLPNFSRSIFLLDEIQALPPRLYTFFVAFLDEFCRQFDSYAIVSTATMPYL